MRHARACLDATPRIVVLVVVIVVVVLVLVVVVVCTPADPAAP